MSKLQNADHRTAIQASYNDVLYIHTGFAAIMRSAFSNKTVFMPQKELWEAYSNCFVHSSVRLSVRPSHFLSGAYLLYSLRQEFQFGVWMHIEIAMDAY